MNCTELDATIDTVRFFLIDNDTGFVIAVALLLLTSLTLLSYGERLVRPLSAIVGGTGACVTVYILSELLGLPCVARVAVSILSGIVVALVALCLFTTGLTLLGAVAFGTVTHFVYESLPMHAIDPPFVLAGRSGYYYLAMLAGVVTGGIVAYVQKKNLIRITSSFIGGSGIAASVHLIGDRTGTAVPPLLLLCILIVASGVGIFLQRFLAQRRRTRTEP